MPTPVHQLLVQGDAPASVTAVALLRALRLAEPAYRAAARGCASALDEAMLRQPQALSAQACAALRAAVDRSLDKAGATPGRDSVDGAADHQLNLPGFEALRAIIGVDETQSLQALPAQFRLGSASAQNVAREKVQIFVRRYGPKGRPWIPFHCDAARLTCNVALSDDSSVRGGKLLVVCAGAVRTVERAEGEATVHSSSLMHGVSRVHEGGVPRYSLIIFVGLQEDKSDSA
jgi:predicted 2-oxoglutarate/Fe(II)-dependent dioxygenase YbiX